MAGLFVWRMDLHRRRWAAFALACAALLVLLRWGMRGPTSGLETGLQTNAVDRLQTSIPVVALTVDAPAGTLLEPIAQALQSAGLPATFFVSAQYAQAHGNALRMLSGQGDEIEVLGGTPIQAKALQRAATLVGDAAGAPPLFVRPAAGQATAPVLRAARSAHLAVATWALPAQGQTAAFTQQMLAALQPGDILRLPATDAAAVPALAKGLKAQGYQAVTLEALVAVSEGAAASSLPTVG